MTEAEAKEAEAEAPDEADERPDIPEDAMAAMEESSAGFEREDDALAGGDDNPMGGAMEDVTRDGHSMGDMYCRALSMLAHVVSEKFGDGEGSEFYDDSAPKREKLDTTLAEEMHLDIYVDELMAKRGRSDLPPGQALAIGTAMFAIAVIATEPALIERITDKLEERNQ